MVIIVSMAYRPGMCLLARCLRAMAFVLCVSVVLAWSVLVALVAGVGSRVVGK